METTAWLFDLYPLGERMVLWFITAQGERLRVEDEFPYVIYLGGPAARLRALARDLGGRGWLRRVYPSRGRDLWQGVEIPVLALELRGYGHLPRLRAWLGSLNGELACYNCDLDVAAYYLYARGIRPCAWYDLEVRDSSSWACGPPKTMKGVATGTQCAPYILANKEKLVGRASVPAMATGGQGRPPHQTTFQLQRLALREDPFAVEFSLPPLNLLHLGLTRDPLIPLAAGNGLALEWEGQTLELEASDIPTLLKELARRFTRLDPDLVLSRGGDEEIIPPLWRWSRDYGIALPLDREPGPVPRRFKGGRSYFSYGQIIYQGGSAPFYGRWHVDRSNSFFFREAGLRGLIQIARLGQVPLQQAARTSPGTLITSMQLARAVSDGILIPWRKGEPERFKSAAELLVIDKGGLTFMPPVGLHFQVAEVDFASMYPTIMTVHNISPETVNCSCCAGKAVISDQWSVISKGKDISFSENRKPKTENPLEAGVKGGLNTDYWSLITDYSSSVPEAGYHLCRRREGLVPRTLRPILRLREELKARARAAPPEEAVQYQERQSALKWMLVTCFGYLGYKNARFGRIEAHEAVTAYGRDKLLTAKEICEDAGCTVLHGLTDCLWLRKPEGLTQGEVEELCRQVSAATGVKLALEGIYRWIVFPPSRQDPQRPVATRYFGAFTDGRLKVRGLACRRRDTPPFVRRAQQELLARLATAATPLELAALRLEQEELAEGFRQRLREGDLTPQDLVITRVLSRPLADFRVDTPSALAARQLERAGIHLVPGEKVRYVHIEKKGPKETRVRAAPFLDTLDNYDAEFYLELLNRAMEEVLLPFGEMG